MVGFSLTLIFSEPAFPMLPMEPAPEWAGTAVLAPFHPVSMLIDGPAPCTASLHADYSTCKSPEPRSCLIFLKQKP